MDNFYRENILDHYRNPRNFGNMEKPDFSFEEENITCGDRIGIQIKIAPPSKGQNELTAIIKDIKFHGEGCAISMASASMLTDKVKKMDIKSVKNMDKDDILALLQIDLTPSRLKCALLPLEALQKTLLSKQLRQLPV